MTDPYILRNPGDAIVAEDWNTIQIKTREEIRSHDHTGGDLGVKLGGGAIDPATSLTVALPPATNAVQPAPPRATPATLALGVAARAEFRLGDGAWRRLVVTTTAEWGDGDANQYLTLGAGGAAGIMLSSPHVTWRDNRSTIRYGRVGGIPGGTYWDVGARPDGSFSAVPIDGGANPTEKLKIQRTGDVVIPALLTVGALNVGSNLNLSAAINTNSLVVAGLDIRGTLVGHNHSGGNSGPKLDGSAIHPGSTLTVTRVAATAGVQVGTAPGAANVAALTVDGMTDFRLGDAGPWKRLVVTTTAEWGDGDANQYMTLGAGGAAGIMLSNPHVTWRDGRASIRHGRIGGTPGGTYWDVGARADGGFSIIAVDGGADGADKLKITKAGNVGIGTGNAAPAARLQVKGGAIMPEVGNSAAAGIMWPTDPGGGGGDGAFLRYSVEAGETTILRLGINNDADDSLRLYQQGGDRLTIQNGQVTIDGAPYTGPQPRALNVPGEIKTYGGGAGIRHSDRAFPLIETRDWVTYVNDNRMYFWRGDVGNLGVFGPGGFGQVSDVRRKRDITSFGSGLDTVLKLRGVRFRWNSDEDDTQPQVGVIAQEIEEHLPELVTEGPDGLKAVAYAGLVAPMIEAIKEQQAQIEALRRELVELRAAAAGGRSDNT